jgi:hypothetical protein
MLGSGRGRVNEGVSMYAATPKSQIFWISVALAPLVRRESDFESVFCGLSPPVLEGRVGGQSV